MCRNSSAGLEPDPNNGAAHDHLNVLDMDAAQPQHQQLSLPQLLVAVLQRALPRLRTAQLQLGTAVLELTHEVLAVLRCVLDQELWTDTRDAAREVISIDVYCDIFFASSFLLHLLLSLLLLY